MLQLCDLPALPVVLACTGAITCRTQLVPSPHALIALQVILSFTSQPLHGQNYKDVNDIKGDVKEGLEQGDERRWHFEMHWKQTATKTRTNHQQRCPCNE